MVKLRRRCYLFLLSPSLSRLIDSKRGSRYVGTFFGA